jgi:predicted dehydrogenase
VVGIDASESKLWDKSRLMRELNPEMAGGSMYEMGSYPLLPIVKLLGTDYQNINIYSRLNEDGVDVYTRGIMRYKSAVSSFQLGLGVKTEGNLVISGTKGYAYVPSPWWKTEYFEIRFENQNDNKKYFFPYESSGLRYEIQEFINSICRKSTINEFVTKEENLKILEIQNKIMNNGKQETSI